MHQQVHVVVFAVHFHQLRLEVLADLRGRFADHLQGALAEHAAAVLCHKDQVHMQQRNDASSSTIFCSFPLARHNEAKYNGGMLTRQAIRVSLRLDARQAQLAERIAGCCRSLYNVALDQRRWFARPGRRIGYVDQAAQLAALKAEFAWFGEAPHHCLQQALLDLEAAYKNFWAGRAGAPQPRKRGLDDAFRFPDPTQITLVGNLRVAEQQRTRSIKQAVLRLPKLGDVACVLHRSIAADARLLSVTVSRQAGRWQASVLLERSVDTPADRSGEPVVGIDLGVAQPVVLSTGQRLALPRASAGDAEHLARLQRRVATKVKGSRNRRKAVARLGAFKARQARRRRDAMEKLTTDLAKNHGVVAMESLRLRAMTASARGSADEPGAKVAAKAGLNRSILDVALGALRARLGQKLAASGGVLLLVEPAHTSQRCARCGRIEALNRPSRDRFACVACGHTDDADANAARNIRDRALGLWGQADAVRVGASAALVLAQQAKGRRGIGKRKTSTGGLPAQACVKRGGFLHAQGRKRAGATPPGAALSAAQEARPL